MKKLMALWVVVLGLIAAVELVAKEAQPGRVFFRWKLTPNQSIGWHLDEKLEQVSKIAGSRIEQQTEISGDFHWNVEAVADDGTATLTQSLDRARVVFRSPTKTFEYDSQSPPQHVDAPLAQAMVRVLNALENGPSTVRIDARGEVVNVEGVSRLVGAAVAMSPLAELIEQTVGDGAIESDFRQIYPALPPGPVGVGDGWSHAVQVGLGPLGSVDATITYTYRGIEQHRGVDCRRIDFALEFEGDIDGNQKAFQIQGKLTKQETTGTVYFDVEGGLVVESRLTSRLAGTFDRRKGEQTQTLELEQTQTLNLRRVAEPHETDKDEPSKS